jgi:hypothetical protein
VLQMLVMDNVNTAARMMAFLDHGHAVQGSSWDYSNMDAVDDRRLVWRSQDRRLVSELSPLHAMAVTADPRHQVRDGDFVNLGAVVSLGWPDWKLLSGSTVYRCGAN